MQFFHKQNHFKVIFKFKSQLNLTKNDIKLGGQFLFPICLDYIGSVFGFCRFHQSGFNSGTFSKKIKYIWPIRFSFQQLRNSFTHALRSCNLVIKMDHEIQILKVIYSTYGVLHRIHQGRRIFRPQAKEDLSTIILIFFLHYSKVCSKSDRYANIKMILTTIGFLRSKKLVFPLAYYSYIVLTTNTQI